jgi:hypothetical protein
MFRNLSWAWKILRSKTVILLTDKEAICHIPFVDLDSFDNVLLLSGQQTALATIRDNVDGLVKEHSSAIEALAERQGVKLEDLRREAPKKKK